MGLDALLKIHGVEIVFFSLYAQRFPRNRLIFKIAIFGHETWPLATVPEVAHIFSFYPRGSKLSSFSVYGQQFPRYGLIFKIATFGHETNLAIGHMDGRTNFDFMSSADIVKHS